MASQQYTLEEYLLKHPDLFSEIVRLMKEEGMAKQEVCSHFGITPGVHARFVKQYPEYSKAFEDGRAFAEAWWMSQGRENLANKGFNVGIYAFQMKNRFKWRDVPLVVGGADRQLSDKFEEKEIVGKYKKTGEENEKIKERVN